MARLKTSGGRELSKADAIWSMLNGELLQHAGEGNWGLYRNTRLSMAAVLERENRLPDALATYLEVMYLDLNGPRNTGGVSTDEFPPFSLSEAFVAPAIEKQVMKLLARLQLDERQARDVFLERAGRIVVNLKLPLSVQEAWARIADLLHGDACNDERG